MQRKRIPWRPTALYEGHQIFQDPRWWACVISNGQALLAAPLVVGRKRWTYAQ